MNAPIVDPRDIDKTLGLATSTHRTQALRRWDVVIALVLVAVTGAWLWVDEGAGQAARYQTEAVQRGDLSVQVTATGNLQPTNQVDVGVEVSGTVASVDVDYNDSVQVGQVLARLDTSRLEAQLHKSVASLEAARARVAQAQATQTETGNTLNRLRALYRTTSGRAPSQQDLDAAEATFKRAQSEVAGNQAAIAEAQATLKLNQTDLDKAVIRSPIDGVVLVRSVEPGQTLAASFQSPVLFTLAENLAQMELHVDVDEADVGHVKPGQPASFTVDAYPGRRFPAQVTQVRFGAQEVEGVITYETVVNVDNTDLVLRPGMTATVDINVQQVSDALLIPNAALRYTPPHSEQTEAAGSVLSKLLPRPPRLVPKSHPVANAHAAQQRVWALRSGQPQEIAVTIGATNGVLTQVLSGDIEPGMALITDVLIQPEVP